MSKLDNFKLFVISRVFGLISLTFAIFLLVSLLTLNGNVNIKPDNFESLKEIVKYGAHISGLLLLLFLDYSSYLIPIFFLHYRNKINIWY